MSDASLLSHEYQTIAEVARAMNEALIDLKKARLRRSQRARHDPRALAVSGPRLVGIVRGLSTSLSSPVLTPDVATDAAELEVPMWALEVGFAVASSDARAASQETVLPEAFVARIRGVQGARMGFFLDDLRAIADTLAVAPTQLSDEHLALLDSISVVADVEASRVFRRFLRG